MKTLLLIAATLTAVIFAGCAQEARTAGVERRQERVDHRTEARHERQEIRSEHADERVSSRPW